MAANKLLFKHGSLDRTLDSLEVEAMKAIAKLEAEELAPQNAGQLLAGLEEEYVVNPLVLHRDRMTREGPRAVEIEFDGERAFAYGSDHATVRGFEVTFIVPFEGDPWLFECMPNSYTSVFPHGEIAGQEYRLTLRDAERDADQVTRSRDWQLQQVVDYIQRQKGQIETFNGRLSGRMNAAIKRRRDELQADAALADAFDVPEHVTRKTTAALSEERQAVAGQQPNRAETAKKRMGGRGTTELHTITSGGKETPPGTVLKLTPSQRPGHINAELRMPDQTASLTFKDLPIRDGVVELPVKLAFLCHATEDKRTVERVAKRLTEDGVLTWLDTKDLLPGDDWQHKIEQAIESSDYVLVFLSGASCSKTGYVQKEIRYALDQQGLRPLSRRYVIPILIDDCAPPAQFSNIHWLRMGEEGWYEKLRRSLS